MFDEAKYRAAVKEFCKGAKPVPLISWAWKWYPLFMTRLSEKVKK